MLKCSIVNVKNVKHTNIFLTFLISRWQTDENFELYLQENAHYTKNFNILKLFVNTHSLCILIFEPLSSNIPWRNDAIQLCNMKIKVESLGRKGMNGIFELASIFFHKNI